MFLRSTKRFKDGKVHYYWSMVLFPEDRAPETDDGRIVTLPRSVEPKPDLAILLNRLGLTLPAQPPPKISGEAADAAKTTV